MPHVKFRNVNDAFTGLVEAFKLKGDNTFETESRVGKVRQVREPVAVTYENPLQRVLFNSARDANCFGHVMESIWMLAGKNDVASVSYYMSDYGKITSDDGLTANGAYGYRWRHAACIEGMGGVPEAGLDQLQIIAEHLKKTPGSRRAVLAMWNVEDDLLKIDVTKDVCCNISCTFQIQEGKLVLTVFNRSNDLIWGMLGANVVHFSMIQEYMAAHIGVEVGPYHQITTNLHVYLDRFKAEEWLADTTPDWYSHEGKNLNAPHFKLVEDPKRFDDELYLFVENVMAKKYIDSFIFREPFFAHVALPMAQAFNAYKAKAWDEATIHCNNIKAWDWQFVAHQWIQKRREKWMSQNPYHPAGTEE